MQFTSAFSLSGEKWCASIAATKKKKGKAKARLKARLNDLDRGSVGA